MSEEKPTITIHELPTSLLAAASLTPLSAPPGMEPPTGLCEHCGERDASCWWVGDGGVLAMIRGWARAWCELCVVEAQLEDAEKQAARLPELRKRRAELRGGPTVVLSREEWAALMEILDNPPAPSERLREAAKLWRERNRRPEPTPEILRIDPSRALLPEGQTTGFFVFATDASGNVRRADIDELDCRSLLVWLRAYGKNWRAEDVIGVCLGHGPDLSATPIERSDET